MISTVPLNASRRRVFGSVFSPASLQARPPTASGSDHDQTQLASFQSTSSTVKTGSFASPQQERFAEAPHDRETWDQAWSTATAFLAVPDQGFAPIYDARETDGSEALKDWNRLTPPSKETAEALSYLTAAAQQGSTAYGATSSQSLIDWYGDEIRRHFLANLRSGLYEVCAIQCLQTGIGTNGSIATENSGERRSAPDDRRLFTTCSSHLLRACRSLSTTPTPNAGTGESPDADTAWLPYGCLLLLTMVQDITTSRWGASTGRIDYLGYRYLARRCGAK